MLFFGKNVNLCLNDTNKRNEADAKADDVYSFYEPLAVCGV